MSNNNNAVSSFFSKRTRIVKCVVNSNHAGIIYEYAAVHLAKT